MLNLISHISVVSDYCSQPVTHPSTDLYTPPYIWNFYHCFFFSFIVCSTVGKCHHIRNCKFNNEIKSFQLKKFFRLWKHFTKQHFWTNFHDFLCTHRYVRVVGKVLDGIFVEIVIFYLFRNSSSCNFVCLHGWILGQKCKLNFWFAYAQCNFLTCSSLSDCTIVTRNLRCRPTEIGFLWSLISSDRSVCISFQRWLYSSSFRLASSLISKDGIIQSPSTMPLSLWRRSVSRKNEKP